MTCPRCTRTLIRNHDEAYCQIHGLIVDPDRAHDLIEEPGPQSQRDVAPNAGRPWTNEDRAFYLANKDTMPAKEIAAWLNRTERGVHHYGSKAGIRKERVARSSQDVTLLKHLNDELEDGAKPGSLGELARAHGLTARAVKERLYRRGVRLRSADGLMSEADVCREYGCTRRRVRRLIQLGILPAARPRKRGVAVRIDPKAVERIERLLRLKVPARGGRK